MIVRGRRPTDTYTVVPNQILTNTKLSWRARGILAFILSKPDGWRTSAAHLAQQGPDGLYAIRTALTELEAAGHLERIRTQDRQGRWTTHTVVHEQALKAEHRPSPKRGYPTSENRAS